MNTRVAPRCLDLSRLVSRVGRGPWTGIDRVEYAYLEKLLALEDPLWGLVRLPGRYALLDKAGCAALEARLTDAHPWDGAPEADVRRLAVASCPRPLLRWMLSRRLGAGWRYLNIGHSNLTERVLKSARKAGARQITVLIHDMIPLDFPQFQRPGTPEKFEGAMRRVSRYADLVICNSEVTRTDVSRYFTGWGRMPKAIVAHLGVTPAVPDTDDLPKGLPLDRPFFVALGTLEPRKNLGLLIKIWEELAKDGVPDQLPALLILGARGWQSEALFAQLDAHPLKEIAIFERPGLSDAGVAALLAGARALLFPSLAEGYGLPPLEAASHGTPVVCGKLNIYQELLGSLPVYLDVNDVYSWVQVVREMATMKNSDAAADPTKHSDVSLPSWSAHFDCVFEET